MKHWTTTLAPRAINRGGVETGAPIISGSRNGVKTPASQAFSEDLWRREKHPYHGSARIQQVLAECEAACSAQQQPSGFTRWSFPWTPRVMAIGIAVSVGFGAVLWMGYWEALVGMAEVEKYLRPITAELAD